MAWAVSSVRGAGSGERKAAATSLGIGRIGAPADTAAVVAFPASAEAEFITGQVIYVGQYGSGRRLPGDRRHPVFDAAVLGFPAMDAVRARGAFVVFSGSAPVPVRGIRVLPVYIHADGAALAGLSRLATAGKLTLRVADTYPLAEAAQAHERLAAGGVRGRLVLVP